MNEYIEKMNGDIVTYLTTKGLNLLLALAVLAIGLWTVKILLNLLERAMAKSKYDSTLNGFVKGLTSIVLKTILIISSAGIAGFPTTTLITVLGAASVAVGFALKDSLSNLAGGIIILAFHPYRAGDFIEFDGISGTLKEVGLVFSVVNTIDNKRVTIPNGELVNAKVTNYSSEDIRRIEIKVGLPYAEDSDRIKSILLDVASKNSFVLEKPEPFCGILEFAQSSVVYTLRVWTKNEHFLDGYSALMEEIKKCLEGEQIKVPYSQFNVHLVK